MGLGFDKVVAPDVIALPGPKPDARAVVQPKPASWPMFSGYFEPLTAPDPLHAITTDPPASLDQQCADPAIAIASVLRSQSDNRSRQRILIRSDDCRVSLRSAWLARLISCAVAWTRFTTTYRFAWASDNSRQCNLPVDRCSQPARGPSWLEPLPAVVEEVELYGVQTPQ